MCWGLFDGFEQGVGGFGGETVGVVEDDYSPLSDGGAFCGGFDDVVTHHFDRDGKFAWDDVEDIAVGVVKHGAALFAAPAADHGGVCAFEGGGECDGRDGAP
ncbi:hypothetical protein FRC0430_01631 [Corynebacterium diphtheriae]|nr:hypothetical protein FRC0430_01631 [Corynebacterium diphtheriae]